MLSPAVVAWLEFSLCAALIAVAGARLSRYGDIIADKTGLGGAWIGLALMATVTSLPELVTGVSAVGLADAPDIAVGNVLGACIINLTMIVFLDLLAREESIYSRASQGHILSAGFGIIMAGFVGFNVLFSQHGEAMSLYYVGAYSPLLLLLYGVAMRTLFRYERRLRAEAVEERVERYPHITLRDALIRYALAASVVVAAGLWLPYVGKDIAQAMAWQETFVGTLFIALATTLPEIVVTISALRIGALDLAISNLLGSNLFNLVIIAIDDIVYIKGPLLSHVSSLHAVSALSVVMMSGVAVVGLFYRPRERLFRTVGWTSLLLLSLYLLNTFFLYLYGG
ncbi:MAG: sodium:calcium antiporter [Gammaproteobacteria bacterium]|nr:sodium:calcium antiporter [Gammaproteobacteria bacterium]